jgi:hypothetical protein
MKRRTFVRGLGAAIALGPAALSGRVHSSAAQGSSGLGSSNPDLTRINPKFLITAQDAHAWHVVKDSHGGPTFSGSPSWKNYLELCEHELRARGVVDIFRNSFTYDRWFTSEWPDDTNWSLHLGGVAPGANRGRGREKIRVASYGAYSGMTPEAGMTAPLVIFHPGMPAEAMRGKIVIIPPGPSLIPNGVQGGRASGVISDYEYLADADTFPNPLTPLAVGGKNSSFGKTIVNPYIGPLKQGGALGMLFGVDLSHDALAGTYNFPVPRRYDIPTLFINRETATKLTQAAKAGQQATLRLIAQTEQAETYQLFGYLPGKNYGKPSDEQVMFITHTDGPSISQENGALGILGMVHYLSKIPQADRPRTILIFLDNRHYMPGSEATFSRQDHAAKHPGFYKSVVAAMGIEHLGQMEYLEEPGKPFHPDGLPELSTVWVTKNQRLVDLAIKSVKDNGLHRVQVECPGRKGLHGGEQGPWYGLGAIAGRLKIPGSATMGSMTAYWSTKARLPAFDADHFVTQVATMSQIAGELMVADMGQIKT